MNPIKRIRKKFSDMSFSIQVLETAVDCMLNSPIYAHSEDVGFNGQMFRKKIFKELLHVCQFEVLIETGTFIGNTTGYMARVSSCPIYTCELNKTHISLAKKRLEGVSNINFLHGDSRKCLRELAKDGLCKRKSFIYLDAHWHDDLPLKEEIAIISDNWGEFVIMVDDFQVPWDNGYGYDNYGRRKSLSLRDVADVFAKHELIPFFPSLASAEETGFKRGCAILVRRGKLSNGIDALDVLRRVPS